MDDENARATKWRVDRSQIKNGTDEEGRFSPISKKPFPPTPS